MAGAFTPQQQIRSQRELGQLLTARAQKGQLNASGLSPVANFLQGIGGGLATNRADRASAENQQLSQQLLQGLDTGENADIARQLIQSQNPAHQAAAVQILAAEQKARATASRTGTSLTPVFGRDAENKRIMLQPTRSGVAKQSQLPEGVQIENKTTKVDLGTHFGVLDVNGNLIGRIPKDLRGKARETEVGKGQGERINEFPKAVGQAQRMKRVILSIRNDPNKSIGVGKSSIGNIVPTTPGFAFQKKVDQLKGGAFLQAFESIKGGGHITEIEGQKATEAITRVSTALSEEAFEEALNDLEEVIESGLDRARRGIVVARPTQQGAIPAQQPNNPVISAGQAANDRAGIPAAAIDALRQNPQMAQQFEQKYGPGSAQQILGQ